MIVLQHTIQFIWRHTMLAQHRGVSSGGLGEL